MEKMILTSEEEIKRMMREVFREEISQMVKTISLRSFTDEEEPMTRKEIAIFLKISVVTLSDWVKRGLPGHRKRKRGRVLFLKSEVIAWLRENPDIGRSIRLK